MTESRSKKTKNSFNLRTLRLSLKYRPEILRLILKMRQCIKKKNHIITKLKHRIKEMENNPSSDSKSVNTQTNNSTEPTSKQEQTNHLEASKDNVKTNEVPQSTKCRNRSTQTTDETIDSKKVKNSKEGNIEEKLEDAGWNVNDNKESKSIAEQVAEVAQDALKETGMVYVESAGMYYDYKTGYYYNSELGLYYHTDTECYYYYSDEKKTFVFHSYPDRSASNAALLAHEKRKAKKHKMERKTEEDIDNLTKNLSQVSLRGKTALESVAKHHPPCMRVIVRETTLPKLRVGSLFIVTKDGGTVGREGEQHTILLRDHNVSRNHLDIQFDASRNLYMATDLGSKNGTILNGTRMSESQIMSLPMEIVHGSTLQLGETKLLCHIHPGNDTCGHCEPGLLMEAIEKEKKVAYTRTCNVQKQHQLELARLKNKYAPKPLAIEETAYNDRAQARRETVGSSHHSEKTQSTDINTSIAPENKGFKMLEKMGWSKGEGLGKESQGETEPVPLVSNEGTAGLGAGRMPSAPVAKNKLGPATMRLATRTKMLKPPAKAFQNMQDEEESE
ncbi:angiogenic factor with G patch and FHA domains 1 isoform X2 [Helicoverpa armigera]|uniref:angiogenic factor with G patch and FHA domains 1 isoform X2 n=1 Tax=Helicoverpa armigera TaxID=29058 RepID=UPI00308352BF